MTRSMELLAGLALLGGVACTRDAASDAGPQPPAGEAWLSQGQLRESGIVVGDVAEREVDSVVLTSGRVTFDDTRVTHVFSPVTGRVTRLVAQPGDRLAAGSPLAALDSPDLGQAVSDFAKAQADLVMAQKEQDRQQELFAAHAGAQRDLEAAEDSFRKAEAELARARAKLKLLAPESGTSAAAEFVLRAPIGGEVIARNVNPGTEVQGQYNGGTSLELFTIGELDRVWVLADIYEVDLPRIRKGAPVHVRVVAYPDRSFEGAVDWVSGALDPASRTAKVRCRIDNPERTLRPEMYATVSVGVAGRETLAIPETAVLRLGDLTYAFVEKGVSPNGRARFERRRVTVEEGSGTYLPVTDGLVAGEKVVTTGAVLLAGMV